MLFLVLMLLLYLSIPETTHRIIKIKTYLLQTKL